MAAPTPTDHEMRGLMSRRLARAVQKVKAGDAVELRVYHDGAVQDGEGHDRQGIGSLDG